MALTRFQNTEEIGADLERLAQDLERLRLTFDQYFLGLEKREPVKLRESVQGLIRKYAGVPIQNSRLKFRYQQTVARYNTFTTYWDRILREIEEGRYRRDLFKAQIHARAQPPTEPEKSSSAPAQAADPVAQLFERYVDSRKRTHEPTEGLALDTFRKALRRQVQTIKKKTGSAHVRFQIKIEGGKTRLKVAPKKG